MTMTRPIRLVLLAVTALVASWLLFFIGPDLFNQHSNLALLGALALYLGVPLAVYYVIRTLRLTKDLS